MRRRLAIVGLVALVAAGLLIAIGAPAGSADPALQRKIDAARGEIESLSAKVESGQSKLVEVNRREDAAANKEQELTDLLTNGREQLAELRQRLADTKLQLEDSRARLARAREALSDRLVGIYKDGRPDAVDLILHADGFDDLITRVEYLRTIQAADEALAARVRGIEAEVQSQYEQVQHLEQQAEDYTERIANARDEIVAARERAAAEAAALRDASAAAGSRLGDLRSSISQWQSQGISNQQVGSWVGGYSIPTYIVMCESGGNYRAVNPSSGAGGAYQIMPSTWRAYGGHGLPQNASKAEQDRIAALIWAGGAGRSQWSCA